MITGPNAGPAMALNIFMRWPPLIFVCAFAGAGAVVYEQVGAEKAIETFKSYAVEMGVMKATKVVEAAKKVDIIPQAVAAPAPTQREAVTPESAAQVTAPTPPAAVEPPKPMSLSELMRIELESTRIARVVVAGA